MTPTPCWVACRDSNGAPEIVHVVVECSPDEFDAGLHYKLAIADVEIRGYTGATWVADYTDPGYKTLIPALLPARMTEVPSAPEKCIKCGSTDLNTVYVAAEELINLRGSGQMPDSTFIHNSGAYIGRAKVEHLKRNCRCCQYAWREPTKDSKPS